MRTLLCGLVAATLLAPIATWAQETDDDATSKRTYYKVEVVLFEHVGGKGDRTQERWEPVVTTPNFDKVAGFERPVLHSAGMASVPEAFVRLNTAEAQLGGAVDRLRSSQDYRVIEHLYWRQPPTPPDEAVPLRFRCGDPMSLQVPKTALRRPPAHKIVEREVEVLKAKDAGTSQGSQQPKQEQQAQASETTEPSQSASATNGGVGADGPSDPQTPTGGDAAVSGSAPDTPFGSGMLAPERRETKVYPLDGTITLVVSRYLHLYVNLHFTTTVDWRKEVQASRTPATRKGEKGSEATVRERVALARNLQGNAVLSYPFEQQRRMRSGKLHYLDHPVLGMLVLVEPVELTPDEAMATPSDAASASETGASGVGAN